MRKIVSLLVLAALLSACGLKGPLYLPPDKKPAAKPPAAGAPAPESPAPDAPPPDRPADEKKNQPQQSK